MKPLRTMPENVWNNILDSIGHHDYGSEAQIQALILEVNALRAENKEELEEIRWANALGEQTYQTKYLEECAREELYE